jgi:hypothetical protein
MVIHKFLPQRLSALSKNYTHVIYNLCQLIINFTVVNADWKEVWYHAVKLNWTITYFTSVLVNLLPLKIRQPVKDFRWLQLDFMV